MALGGAGRAAQALVPFPVVSQPRMNDEFMNGARSNFRLLLRIRPLPTSAPAVTMLEGTTCNTPIVDLRGGVGG